MKYDSNIKYSVSEEHQQIQGGSQINLQSNNAIGASVSGYVREEKEGEGIYPELVKKIENFNKMLMA